MTAVVEHVALTRDAARALTDEIKVRVTDLLPLIREAFQRRADKALGYETWADYCRAELSDIRVPVIDRPDAVAELNELGMSQRQIGDALGISNATVSRHLRPSVTYVTDGDRSSSPEPVAPVEDIELPEEEERPLPGMPEGYNLGEAIAAGIDAGEEAVAEPGTSMPDVPLFGEPEPERPRPPKWDPVERRQHETEALRVRDIADAQQQAKTLVPDVRALIFTVLQGSRQGAKGLVTRDMVADIRRAVDLLEGEINDEE